MSASMLNAVPWRRHAHSPDSGRIKLSQDDGGQISTETMVMTINPRLPLHAVTGRPGGQAGTAPRPHRPVLNPEKKRFDLTLNSAGKKCKVIHNGANYEDTYINTLIVIKQGLWFSPIDISDDRFDKKPKIPIKSAFRLIEHQSCSVYLPAKTGGTVSLLIQFQHS